MNPLACVTGRFQPVHHQHLELFALALRECSHLVVAVTNPDSESRRPESASAHRHTPAANPFTYYERVRLLTAALRGAGMGGRTTIVPFDLARPQVWTQYVPPHARQFVRAYSAWERDKAERLATRYPVTVLDGDQAVKVDATGIREQLGRGAWSDALPPATVPVLRELLAATPLADRG